MRSPAVNARLVEVMLARELPYHIAGFKGTQTDLRRRRWSSVKGTQIDLQNSVRLVVSDVL